MFKALLFTLTASSVLKMLALIGLIGGGLYGLTTYYLSYVTDQALREAMTLKFRALGLSIPADLVEIEPTWNLISQMEEAYDEDEVANVIIPLDANTQVVANLPNLSDYPTSLTDPDLPDRSAVQVARDKGSDLRSIYTGNGIHLRLLTFQLPRGAPIAYLQIGKVLADEDRIKHRLLLVLFATGTIATMLSGSVSWWLARRSLQPTRRLWERQQTFVANASHELRTPLTLIRASAEVAQRALAAHKPQQQMLDTVLIETDYMTKLVDDLLLLSRLDASQLKLEQHTIELNEMLPTLQCQAMAWAHERGITIHIDQAQGNVLAYPVRLHQVLLILVDNALRHTPAGGCITLSAQARKHAVHIKVIDTGKGIQPRDLQHVFERFYQADGSRGDKRSAGLGLSIAKLLIELHGGEITIDSQVGVGTQVTIVLPKAPKGPTHVLKARQASPEPEFTSSVVRG